ncbi:FAD/NAD(P)-binding domain-containing protein [Colletotrichum zoysiae]|uniref:FAD/NAD(P)-binding domain-containing protein n=1 Tax=Colletotrichum zoysiae TaxID=1216348 RepID=A0AAD9HSJ5_9PEZI|nr:FAD/NAD(P)-binding domain-containing protein [Colletotrichum zoysiae]
MKVIIVGAGVAGLSAYLQLKKLLTGPGSHTIVIYEAHRNQSLNDKPNPEALSETTTLTDSSAVVGNVIVLSPTALRVLRHIDEGLYDLFQSRGYRNDTYRFRTARCHPLSTTSTDDKKTPREYATSCPRALLRDCLAEIVGESNIQYRKIIAVDLGGANPVVRFSDGGEETADLVLGADGVRSVVKTAIVGSALDAKQGFCGVGGFLQVESLPPSVLKQKSVVFTFGPSGSFGYCSVAPQEQGKLGWWSIWGRPEIPHSNVMLPSEIRRQLHDRHGTWKDPVIQHIVNNMTTDRIYPIWTTPDLPFWSAGGAVLLGDAAHTLPATSGQGAGQALEDSVVFSLLLAHYINNVAIEGMNAVSQSEAIQLAAKGLFEIQAPRVAAIKRQSRNLYLTDKRINNAVFEYIYYLYLYLLTIFPILCTSNTRLAY